MGGICQMLVMFFLVDGRIIITVEGKGRHYREDDSKLHLSEGEYRNFDADCISCFL